MLTIIVLILLVLLIMGGLPTIGYPHGYGYAPSGLLTIALVVLLLWFVLGRH